MALYGPDNGFFTSGAGAGRQGHFLTSPEVGPLFAAVLARALDTWWVELGRPDPFVVVEAGAGSGTLARDVLAARPTCAPALRYVLVERSPSLRARQAAVLALEPPEVVLGPSGDDEADGVAKGALAAPSAGGPAATSLADLPAQQVTGVVVANELLDNLPFLLLERQREQPAAPASRWLEVRVGEADGCLREVLVPAPPSLVVEADRLAPEAPQGGRLPLQHDARAWLRRALSLLNAGRVVVIDYADTSSSLVRRPWLEWLRTYRNHARGRHPLEHSGNQDITCEVAVDQLVGVRALACDRTQADFLVHHGVHDLVATARQVWTAAAGFADLEAVRARSRVTEASALLDPAGLGAFRVLEWAVP